jgi:hypothetical protein
MLPVSISELAARINKERGLNTMIVDKLMDFDNGYLL